MDSYWSSLGGGMLIGCSAALMLLLNGQIAGISGIVGGLLHRPSSETIGRVSFLCGLLLGPVAFRTLTGHWPSVTISSSWTTLIVSGLLVGFGTRLGGGCTSGHGVCGLARLSRRSIAAVTTFMAVAAATVFLVKHGVAQ